MGRPYTKCVLENLLKNQSFRFGSLVEYYPISAKDQSRIHQFGKKVLPGLFLGYALYAGRIWKGDVLVADIEELETMDASEIYFKKTQRERGDISQKKEKFQSQMDESNFLEWDQDLRTFTSIRERPIQGESHVDFLGESEGSPPPPLQDSFPDADEAMNDFFGPCQETSYTAITLNPESNFTRREKNHSQFHWKYIDVSRTTRTNLDVMQERRIDDYWNVDGSRDLSDSWTGFTQFTL